MYRKSEIPLPFAIFPVLYILSNIIQYILYYNVIKRLLKKWKKKNKKLGTIVSND